MHKIDVVEQARKVAVIAEWRLRQDPEALAEFDLALEAFAAEQDEEGDVDQLRRRFRDAV